MNVVDYCRTINFRHKATRLKAFEVQGSWRSRRVAFEGTLTLVGHGLQIACDKSTVKITALQLREESRTSFMWIMSIPRSCLVSIDE